MKKRFFFIVLCLIAVLLVFCSCSDKNDTTEPVEEANPASDFEYESDSNGGIIITKYIGTDDTVVVPEEIEGKPVTQIYTTAFYGFTAAGEELHGENIKEITVPAALKCITELHFGGCLNLEKVIFKGDAPDNFDNEGDFVPANRNYTIYYTENAKGFTSPVWNGYKSAVIGTECRIGVYNDFEYLVNENDEITIFNYLGTSENIEIPEEIDNKKVTSIGRNSFAYNQNIVNVVLPDTVKVIEDSAFYSCNSLKSVTLSKNLEHIGICAFNGCDSLSEIMLPDSLETIEERAFHLCHSLTKINIPKKITHIRPRTFSFSGLKTITFNDALELIDNEAFASTKITNIEIPENVYTISNHAFAGCPLESVTLNYGLETIGDNAFNRCKISEIVIPETVKNMTELAFNNANKLESVKFEGNAPKTYVNPEEKAQGANYTVYYHKSAKGFTSAEWNNYKTEVW